MLAEKLIEQTAAQLPDEWEIRLGITTEGTGLTLIDADGLHYDIRGEESEMTVDAAIAEAVQRAKWEDEKAANEAARANS